MFSRRSHLVGMLVGAVALLLAGALAPDRARAQPQPGESQAKATYVLWFAQNALWRNEDFSSNNAPLVIGILGESPFEKKEIETLKSSSIQKRKVEVKFLGSVEEVEGCHILFIASSEKRRLAQTLQPLKDRRILTISDIEGFTQEGGVASVVIKQIGVTKSKPVPNVSKEAATRVGLEFSPTLYAAVSKLRAN
jgi:hypothetical protein